MNPMNQAFCQCCGMPMGAADGLFGTETNGVKNEDYCKYCYENGAFTFSGSMEEMIEVCVPHMVEANPNMSAEEAREMMQQFFPKLKRWNSR